MASGTQGTGGGGAGGTGGAGGGGGGGDGGVQSALENFKAASQEASAKSIKVAQQMTEVNGTKGALTKISPG